ncbi:rod shape-determining protein MreC, partial [Candidatus Falkowbacteria bacterium CG10_big_fil_rev_8_21_14_0_10_43_10]
KLTAENVRLKVLEDENKALREQINFYSRHQYQKMVANIISRKGTGKSSQIIIIDKGESDGVKAGQAIIAGSGIIAGKIFSVDREMSHGYLLTDERCQVAASLVGEDKVSGIARGELGLTVKMDFIPQKKAIQSGNIIITSGLEPAIPKGLIIGDVQSVEKENNNLFQSAVINPSANLSTLSIVSIIVN